MGSQESKHCCYSVAMNIIHPEVGTLGHFLLQVMILLDLSSLAGVDPGQGFLLIEANREPVQVVWYEMLKS